MEQEIYTLFVFRPFLGWFVRSLQCENLLLCSCHKIILCANTLESIHFCEPASHPVIELGQMSCAETWCTGALVNTLGEDCCCK